MGSGSSSGRGKATAAAPALGKDLDIGSDHLLTVHKSLGPQQSRAGLNKACHEVHNPDKDRASEKRRVDLASGLCGLLRQPELVEPSDHEHAPLAQRSCLMAGVARTAQAGSRWQLCSLRRRASEEAPQGTRDKGQYTSASTELSKLSMAPSWGLAARFRLAWNATLCPVQLIMGTDSPLPLATRGARRQASA